MRLVLLAFEDNDTADAFVKAIKDNQVIIGQTEDEDGAQVLRYKDIGPDVTAEAMWAAPTKLCTCHPPYALPNKLAKAGSGLNCFSGRSKKFGWLLCTKCMKPHGFQTIHPKNLLGPEVEDLQDRKFVLGFEAKKTGVRDDVEPA